MSLYVTFEASVLVLAISVQVTGLCITAAPVEICRQKHQKTFGTIYQHYVSYTTFLALNGREKRTASR